MIIRSWLSQKVPYIISSTTLLGAWKSKPADTLRQRVKLDTISRYNVSLADHLFLHFDNLNCKHAARRAWKACVRHSIPSLKVVLKTIISFKYVDEALLKFQA